MESRQRGQEKAQREAKSPAALQRYGRRAKGPQRAKERPERGREGAALKAAEPQESRRQQKSSHPPPLCSAASAERAQPQSRSRSRAAGRPNRGAASFVIACTV